MLSLDRSATVAQIVLEHSAAARIFQKHRIDYCCRGDVTVPEACQQRSLDPDAVFAELEDTLRANGASHEDARLLSTPELLDMIVERHHGYLRRALPFVGPLAVKVASVHGEKNDRLEALRDTVAELASALEPHLEVEERVLFPALRAPSPDVLVVGHEMATMLEDHLEVGTLLERMRSLADDFTVPPWGCNSYRVLMSELEALEGDILRHVHLENHVLVPRFAGETEPA